MPPPLITAGVPGRAYWSFPWKDVRSTAQEGFSVGAAVSPDAIGTPYRDASTGPDSLSGSTGLLVSVTAFDKCQV